MATHTQKGSVSVDAFQWPLGGKISTFAFPGWAARLALHTSGDGKLQIPTHQGVVIANPTDWVVLAPDGTIDIDTAAKFAALYN